MTQNNRFDNHCLSQDDWIECDKILLNEFNIHEDKAISDLISAFDKRMFKFQLKPDVLPTLRQLKSFGVKLGILSNLNDKKRNSERYHQLKDAQIFDLMDIILLSNECEYSKPDPGIFEFVLQKLSGIKPHETIYVGDTFIFDVMGAQNAGMHPVLLDPNGGIEGNFDTIQTISDIIPYLQKFQDCS